MNYKNKKSKKIAIAVVSAIIAIVMLVSAFTVFADPVYDMGGGNTTGPGGSTGTGNTVPSGYDNTSAYPIAGIRISVVNKNGTSRGQTINILADTSFATGRYAFKSVQNKVQRRTDMNPQTIEFVPVSQVAISCADTAIGLGTLAGKTAQGLQAWEQIESNSMKMASIALNGNCSAAGSVALSSQLRTGEVLIVEGLYPLKINNTNYLLTMSEYGIIGGQKAGDFNAVPGDSGNTGQISFIGKTLGYYWPYGMYAPLGTLEPMIGRGRNLGSYSGTSSQITWSDMIFKAFGVHFVYDYDTSVTTYTVTVKRSVPFITKDGDNIYLGNTTNGYKTGQDVDEWVFTNVPRGTVLNISNMYGCEFVGLENNDITGGSYAASKTGTHNTSGAVDIQQTYKVPSDVVNNTTTSWRYNFAASWSWNGSSTSAASTSKTQTYTVNSDLTIRIVFTPKPTNLRIQKWYMKLDTTNHTLATSYGNNYNDTNHNTPMARVSWGNYALRQYGRNYINKDNINYFYDGERWAGRSYSGTVPDSNYYGQTITFDSNAQVNNQIYYKQADNQSRIKYKTASNTNAASGIITSKLDFTEYHSAAGNKQYMMNGFNTSSGGYNQINMMFKPVVSKITVQYYRNEETTPYKTRDCYYSPSATIVVKDSQGNDQTITQTGEFFQLSEFLNDGSIDYDAYSLKRITYTRSDACANTTDDNRFSVWSNSNGTPLTSKSFTVTMGDHDDSVVKIYIVSKGDLTVRHFLEGSSTPTFISTDKYNRDVTLADGTHITGDTIIPKSYEKPSSSFSPEASAIKYNFSIDNTASDYAVNATEVTQGFTTSASSKVINIYYKSYNDITVRHWTKNGSGYTQYGNTQVISNTYGAGDTLDAAQFIKTQLIDNNYLLENIKHNNTVVPNNNGVYNVTIGSSNNVIDLFYAPENKTVNVRAVYLNYDENNTFINYGNLVGRSGCINPLYDNEKTQTVSLGTYTLYENSAAKTLNCPADGSYSFSYNGMNFPENKVGVYKTSTNANTYAAYTKTTFGYNDVNDGDVIVIYYAPYQYKVNYDKNSQYASDTYNEANGYYEMENAMSVNPLAVQNVNYPTQDNKYRDPAATFVGWHLKNNETNKWYGYSTAGNAATLGWYTEPAEYAVISNEGVININKRWGSVTLYAQWEEIAGTGIKVYYSYQDNPFTHNVTGVTGEMREQVITATSRTLLENQFKRSGYDFNGWKVALVAVDDNGNAVYTNNLGNLTTATSGNLALTKNGNNIYTQATSAALQNINIDTEDEDGGSVDESGLRWVGKYNKALANGRNVMYSQVTGVRSTFVSPNHSIFNINDGIVKTNFTTSANWMNEAYVTTVGKNTDGVYTLSSDTITNFDGIQRFNTALGSASGSFKYVIVCYAQWKPAPYDLLIRFVDEDGNPAFTNERNMKVSMTIDWTYMGSAPVTIDGRTYNNGDIVYRKTITEIVSASSGYFFNHTQYKFDTTKIGSLAGTAAGDTFIDNCVPLIHNNGSNQYLIAIYLEDAPGSNTYRNVSINAEFDNGPKALSSLNGAATGYLANNLNNNRWNQWRTEVVNDREVLVRLYRNYTIKYDLQNGTLSTAARKRIDSSFVIYENAAGNPKNVLARNNSEISSDIWRIYKLSGETKLYLGHDQNDNFGWFTADNISDYFELSKGARFGPSTDFPDSYTFEEIVKIRDEIIFEAQYQKTVNVIVEDEDGNLAYGANAWISYLKAVPSVTNTDFVTDYSKQMINASAKYFNVASERFSANDYLARVQLSNDNVANGSDFTNMYFTYNSVTGISTSPSQTYETKTRMPTNPKWSHYSIKLVNNAASTDDTKYFSTYGVGDYVIITLYDDFYQIAYDANGGTGTMANQKALSGEDIQLRANAFTRSGYKYRFWYASYVDGSNTTLWYGYNSSNVLGWYNGSTVVKKYVFHDQDVVNFTLSKVTVIMHAQWAKDFTVTYFDGDTDNYAFTSWLNSVSYKRANVSGDYTISAENMSPSTTYYPQSLVEDENLVVANSNNFAAFSNNRNGTLTSNNTLFRFRYNADTGLSESPYHKSNTGYDYGALTPFNPNGMSPVDNQTWNAYKLIVRDASHLDIRLYQIRYTVNYDGNGASGDMNSDTALPNTDYTIKNNEFYETYTAQAGINIGQDLSAQFIGYRLRDDDTNLWYGYSSYTDESTLGWYESPAKYYLYNGGDALNLNKWDSGSVTLVAQWFIPLRIDYVYADTNEPVFSGPNNSQYSAAFDKWSTGVRLYYINNSGNAQNVVYPISWDNGTVYVLNNTQIIRNGVVTNIEGVVSDINTKLLVMIAKDPSTGATSAVANRDQCTPVYYNKRDGLNSQQLTEHTFTKNEYFEKAEFEILSPAELLVKITPKRYTINYVSSTPDDTYGTMAPDTNRYGLPYSLRTNDFYKTYDSYFRCWYIHDDDTNLWYGYSTAGDASTLGWYANPARYYEAKERESFNFDKVTGSYTCYAQWKTPFIVSYVKDAVNPDTNEIEEVAAYESAYQTYVYGRGFWRNNAYYNFSVNSVTTYFDINANGSYNRFLSSPINASDVDGYGIFGKTYNYEARIGKTASTPYNGGITAFPFQYNTNTGIAAKSGVNYDTLTVFASNVAPTGFYAYKVSILSPNEIKIKLYTKDEVVDHYIVNYDKNAEDAFGTMASTKQYRDEPFNLSNNLFTRADYAFKGWYLRDDITGKWYGKDAHGDLGWYDTPVECYLFANQQSCTLPMGEIPIPNTSVTFYAQWRANFRVHFLDENGNEAFTSWNSAVRYETKTTAGLVHSTAANNEYYPSAADVALGRTFTGYVVFGPTADADINLSNSGDYNRVFFEYNSETGISMNASQVYDEEIDLLGCVRWGSYSVSINELTNDIYITLYPIHRELSVVYYQPNANYSCDTTIIASFKVTNPTELKYNPDDGMATLRVNLTGHYKRAQQNNVWTVDLGTQSKDFVIPARKSQNVYFKYVMPSAECNQIIITADILYGGEVIGTYHVTTNDGSSGFTTQIVNKDEHQIARYTYSDKAPDGYGYRTTEDLKRDTSVFYTGNNASKWDEYVYTGNGNYEKKTYYAVLRIDTGLTRPNQNAPVWWYDDAKNQDTDSLGSVIKRYTVLRSGYGIDTHFASKFGTSSAVASATGGTQCTNVNALVQAQFGNVYFAENDFGRLSIPENMFIEEKNSLYAYDSPYTKSKTATSDQIRASHFYNGSVGSWLKRGNITAEQFNYASRSYFFDYNHFTPVWARDGDYPVKVVATDCWTPAGMLTATNVIDTCSINGSLYSDYYWVHGDAMNN